MRLSCFVIDDEPLSLDLTCNFVTKTPFLELSGRYGNALEAVAAIQQHPVDLLFLDIEMPDLTGVELASLLIQNKLTPAPMVIFTTAYNQFALDGFRVNAIDYLLKPFSYEDFLRASSKASSQSNLMIKQEKGNDELDHLFVKSDYSLTRIDFSDILYIEGFKDYVKIFHKNDVKPMISLTSLKALEEKLSAKRFMRVHRSFIVSLDKMSFITKTSLQIGKSVIPIGSQFKDEFRKFVESRIA